jgi:glutamate formiminotransferase / 5-formyltetrahydrofolate cyclo-ligase
VIDALRTAAGDALLDVHLDADHHRCVLTLGATSATYPPLIAELARAAVDLIDLRGHKGVHPRLGALDVVPLAPLAGTRLDDAIEAREAVLVALGALGIPCFRYGPLPDGSVRTLPELRRRAFVDLEPDAGPPRPHPTAGATAVGARQPLVAWNLWLQGASLATTRRIATALRSEDVRALGLEVRGATQVSCNLVEPVRTPPHVVYSRVVALLPERAHVVRCELVGLVPDRVLDAVPASWWALLDLAEERSVERAAARIGLGV